MRAFEVGLLWPAQQASGSQLRLQSAPSNESLDTAAPPAKARAQGPAMAPAALWLCCLLVWCAAALRPLEPRPAKLVGQEEVSNGYAHSTMPGRLGTLIKASLWNLAPRARPLLLLWEGQRVWQESSEARRLPAHRRRSPARPARRAGAAQGLPAGGALCDHGGRLCPGLLPHSPGACWRRGRRAARPAAPRAAGQQRRLGAERPRPEPGLPAGRRRL